MTPIQRRACLHLRRLRLGYYAPRGRAFVQAMIALGESERWPSIELTPRQRASIARVLRRFHRQVSDPNVLFWAQRELAEQAIPELATTFQEEPCQS